MANIGRILAAFFLYLGVKSPLSPAGVNLPLGIPSGAVAGWRILRTGSVPCTSPVDAGSNGLGQPAPQAGCAPLSDSSVYTHRTVGGCRCAPTDRSCSHLFAPLSLPKKRKYHLSQDGLPGIWRHSAAPRGVVGPVLRGVLQSSAKCRPRERLSQRFFRPSPERLPVMAAPPPPGIVNIFPAGHFQPASETGPYSPALLAPDGTQHGKEVPLSTPSCRLDLELAGRLTDSDRTFQSI